MFMFRLCVMCDYNYFHYFNASTHSVDGVRSVVLSAVCMCLFGGIFRPLVVDFWLVLATVFTTFPEMSRFSLFV